MSTERDRILRSLAEEMARALCEGGDTSLMLMQRFGLCVDPDDGRRGGARSPSVPGSIGLWEPGSGAGADAYVRSPTRREEWNLWADLPALAARGSGKRVLFLGESVARGYFYDPGYTPAGVLAALLTALLEQPVEVVDLAKNDLGSEELAELAGAALALQPDALVIFAGNNWGQAPTAMDDNLDRYLAAAVLRQDGVAGFKLLREQRLSAQIGIGLRQHLSALSRRLPVVLIVPEFNLAGWHLDAETDAPWLPAGCNRRWLACRTAALAALAGDRIDEAQAAAEEMVEIDRGTAAAPWVVLAECARRRGELDAARESLENARDARIWDNSPQTPKSLRVLQRALRGCALPGRVAVVDLPRLIAAWQDGGLPDHRLFLDYCHLTADGIRLAMAAMALAVAPLLGASTPLPELTSVVDSAPRPDSRLEAEAHFAAGIHSAHWGQPAAVVARHCRAAAGWDARSRGFRTSS